MQSQQISPANGFTLGLAATVPTFLLLSLNGTALFYGIGTVLSLSIIVGLTATLASFAGKKTMKK